MHVDYEHAEQIIDAAIAKAAATGVPSCIAVVDSGVASSHPDLASRLIDEQCFCSGASGSVGCCPNRQDTQSGVGAAFDDNGHGTNVSGIIVGEGIVAPRGAVPDNP